MKLPFWLLPALSTALFSHSTLQITIEAMERAITCYFFSTLTKVFSTRAQMALHQSPKSALHTAVPWAKTCAA